MSMMQRWKSLWSRPYAASLRRISGIFVPFAERIATLAAWGSVSQIALKLMSPGVIDTYQGGELWDLGLVDPDNRRPVDYATRQHKLHSLTKNIVDSNLSPEKAFARSRIFAILVDWRCEATVRRAGVAAAREGIQPAPAW